MKTNDKNKYKDFGDRLSLIMYKQNISNIQLANAMFVSPSTISGYRTGRRSPTVADLAACSRSKFLSKIFKIIVKNFREIFPVSPTEKGA